MELAASGTGRMSSTLRTSQGLPPPLDTSPRLPTRPAAAGPQPLPARTHVLERPPAAAPQPPPLPARPQNALPAAEETRDAESFRAKLLVKGRSQVPEPR